MFKPTRKILEANLQLDGTGMQITEVVELHTSGEVLRDVRIELPLTLCDDKTGRNNGRGHEMVLARR